MAGAVLYQVSLNNHLEFIGSVPNYQRQLLFQGSGSSGSLGETEVASRCKWLESKGRV